MLSNKQYRVLLIAASGKPVVRRPVAAHAFDSLVKSNCLDEHGIITTKGKYELQKYQEDLQANKVAVVTKSDKGNVLMPPLRQDPIRQKWSQQ